MGFLGFEEEDIYTTSCSICPLFDTYEKFVKKAMVYTALSKLMNNLDSKGFIDVAHTRGYSQLKRFYRKGKATFIDHLPDVCITGMSFNVNTLQNYLDRLEGEKVGIKTISLQRPTGTVYAKYLLQKNYDYDPDIDMLEQSSKYFKFSSYDENTKDSEFTVSLETIDTYMIQNVEFTYKEIENIRDGTTTVTGTKEVEENVTVEYVSGYETRDVKKGDKISVVQHDSDGTIWYDTEGNPLKYEFTIGADGTFDFPIISTRTEKRKKTVEEDVEVDAVLYTEATYVSTANNYVRADTNKVFKTTDMTTPVKDSSRNEEKAIAYGSGEIDGVKYSTPYADKDAARSEIDALSDALASYGATPSVTGSTTKYQVKEYITNTYEIPLENYYLVDYSTKEKGTNFFFASMDEAEEKGLKRDPIQDWKNDSKGSLDALPIVLIRYEKENLNNIGETNKDTNDILTVERYKSTKKLLKSIGIKLDELTTGLRVDKDGNEVIDNETWGQISNIFFHYGVRFIDDWTIKEGQEVIPEGPRGISKYLYVLFSTIHTKFLAFKDADGNARVVLEVHENNDVYHGAFHNKIFWDVSVDKMVEGNVKDLMNDPRIKKKCNKGFAAHKVVEKKYIKHHYRYWHVYIEMDRKVSVHPNGFIEWEDVEEVYELPDNTLYARNPLGTGRVDMPYGRNYMEYAITLGLLTGKAKSDMDLRKVDDEYNKIIYFGKDKPDGPNPVEENYAPVKCTVIIDEQTNIPSYKNEYDPNLDDKLAHNYNHVYYNNYERFEKQEIAFDKKWVPNQTDRANDDYIDLTHRLVEAEAYGDYNGDGSYYTQTKKVLSVYVYYQYDSTKVHILQLDNVWAYKVVYRPDGVDEHIQNARDDGCFIPLIWFPVRKMNLKEKISLYHRCIFLQFHAVQHEHLEWYESESFNLFIAPVIRIAAYVVAIVMMVIPGGQLPSAATLMWATAAYISVSAISAGLMQMGNTGLAIAFAVVSAAFTIGSSISNAMSSAISIGMASTNTCLSVLSTAANISQIVAEGDSAKVKQEMLEFQEEYKDRKEILGDAQALLTQADIISPEEMIQLNQSNPIALSPSNFLSIAVEGTTNLDFSVANYAERNVSDFVNIALQPQNVD